MRARIDLDNILLRICDNVYYQPPESLKMKFPAIVYERSKVDTTYADDTKYLNYGRYSVTVIDKEEDSEIADAVHALPLCSSDREFKTNNMHHYVFTLYF